ncbi:aminomethyl-transferring glycine dehydrogenase subunit GcvPB [Magnetococcales bacterium HHB-1]
MVIFSQSGSGERASQGLTLDHDDLDRAFSDIPEALMRQQKAGLPSVSELEMVRHYSRLSQKNYGIDTHMYPLGSCTMKYNPRVCHALASQPGFLERHPFDPESAGQGVLASLYELQEMLKKATGMAGFSLAPMAGAQGEFAGVAMIRAYHQTRKDFKRTEILIPDAAHGTNPATAAMCGFTVREVATTAEGDVDLEALKAVVGENTAGLMLTNPSTLGVFERDVLKISEIVHQAGGLLYYDGANLNAIAGVTRPGDMGFDCVHVNVHKTFATPHGGGGPGAGPVGVNDRLLPYLPIPSVGSTGEGFRWLDEKDRPETIGRLSTFAGNIGVLLRAYVYMKRVGDVGLRRIAYFSTLNANYLFKRLKDLGFQAAFPERRATHEFIITLEEEKKRTGVTALDFAKRLLDYGFYAPTIYFPMLVPECLLIEPTETESKAELDRFVDAMVAIRKEMDEAPEKVKGAPWNTPIRRLDETRAARQPDLVWRED